MRKTISKAISLLMCMVVCICLVGPMVSAADDGLTTYLNDKCTIFGAYGTGKTNTTAQMWSYPCDSTTNSGSKKVVQVPSGSTVKIICGVKNTTLVGAHHTWYEVEYDSDTTCWHGYIYEKELNTSSFDGSLYITDKCTKYPCDVHLQLTKDTTIYSLPCNDTQSNAFSKVLGTEKAGAEAVSTCILTNAKENGSHCWYRINYGTNTGYIYAGHVSTTLKFDSSVTISDVTAPKGQRTAGALTLKGKITSEKLNLYSVETKVVDSSTNSKVTGGSEKDINKKSYSIKGNAPDNDCKLAKANDKTVLYVYTITAKVINYYSTDGKTLSSQTEKKQLYRSEFWVGSTKPTVYTITYNANGGYNAPDEQTKKNDVTIKLRTDIPGRGNTSPSPFTVTLNANGGSSTGVDGNKLTATRTTMYSFSNWNTAADGSGTSYASGANYSKNANVTLYAQWTSSTVTEAVTLPTPTRTGYSFQGWSTDSSAASGVTGSYTPTGNVTLYATWSLMRYSIIYYGNGGSGVPERQYKNYNESITLSSTIPSRASVAADPYTVSLNANGGTLTGVEGNQLTAPCNTVYSFANWNTASNGNGTSYAPGATYSQNASLRLYAQWTAKTVAEAVTLPVPVREGYSFRGWATSSTAASGVKGSYTPNGNVTLYATWREAGLSDMPVLSAIYNSSNGADIRFEALDGATAYVIERKENGVWSDIATVKASDLEKAGNDLKYIDKTIKGREYYGKGYIYSVAAIIDGEKTEYDTIGLALYRLEQPEIKSVKVDANGKCSANWNSTNAHGYELQYSSDNGKTWNKMPRTTGTSITFEGLVPGTEYVFRLRSYKDNADRGRTYSEYSPWAKAQDSIPVVVNIYNSANGADIRWQADGNDSYTIMRKENGVWKSIKTVKASALEKEGGNYKYIDTEIKNNYGKGYIYSVAVTDSNGTLQYDTSGLALYRLAVPEFTSVRSSNESNGTISVTLTWNTVAAHGYEVQYSSDGGKTWTKASQVTGTTQTIKGLNKNTEYVFRIRCQKTNADRGTTWSQYSEWAVVGTG